MLIIFEIQTVESMVLSLCLFRELLLRINTVNLGSYSRIINTKDQNVSVNIKRYQNPRPMSSSNVLYEERLTSLILSGPGFVRKQTRVSGLFRRRVSTKYVQLRSRNKNRQLVQNVLMYYLLRYFKSSTKFNRLGYITEPLFSGISTAVVSFS